ncbi:CBS domain-containing protein [Nioella nitratireducens]|uniref:CBS domain-containing protein n=1 Tax=Nioella nitratireducens TaxID=1287720 RepID=UPI0008FD6C19|nr:CBS domain-containing protein [Nioella nitratireducens]
MLVQQILKSKPDVVVVTIAPGSKLSDAAETLSTKKIGAIIVSPDGKSVAGILSERDIVRELGKRGPSCMSDLVDDIMTADIVSCAKGDSSDAVLAKMTAGRFRHMPVIEDGAMIGLISIGDVVKAQLSKLSMEKEALEDMIKGF